jgi:hypothetical protein
MNAEMKRHHLSVVGHLMKAKWYVTAVCHVTGFVDVRALPVIKSVAEGSAVQSVIWLVPLWVLCIVFWAAAYRDARNLWLDHEGEQSKAKVSGPFV